MRGESARGILFGARCASVGELLCGAEGRALEGPALPVCWRETLKAFQGRFLKAAGSLGEALAGHG